MNFTVCLEKLSPNLILPVWGGGRGWGRRATRFAEGNLVPIIFLQERLAGTGIALLFYLAHVESGGGAARFL